MAFELKKMPKTLGFYTLNIRMEHDILAILKDLAKEAGINKSKLGREMILHCLRDLNKIK